jgi:hypothetical protein
MKTFKTALLLLVALGAASCSRPSLRTLPLPAGCDSWEPLPMTVSLDPSASDYRDEVNHAMKSWNAAMGRAAFVWSYVDETPADVLIAQGQLYGNVRGVGPSFCHDSHVSAVVILSQGLDTLQATAFAAHELGHTLGLGHSPVRSSIMFPLVDVSLMGDWDSQVAQRILPSDARIARALHSTRDTYAIAVQDAGPDNGIGTSPSISEPMPADAWSAFGAGHYALGVTLALMAALVLLRRIVPALFASDLAGAATAFGVSLLGAMASSLSTGVPFGWGMVSAAFTVAVLAMGGYSVAWKKLLKPALRWAAVKFDIGWLSKALG